MIVYLLRTIQDTSQFILNLQCPAHDVSVRHDVKIVHFPTGPCNTESVSNTESLITFNIAFVFRITHWSPATKVMWRILRVFICPVPLFLLALTRLIKLVLQYMNPGQTICTRNYLNPDSPPLGTESIILSICVNSDYQSVSIHGQIWSMKMAGMKFGLLEKLRLAIMLVWCLPTVITQLLLLFR